MTKQENSLKSKASQEGYDAGLKDKGKFLPEPYPPYPLGTTEANEWISSYRIARFGKDNYAINP